MSRGDHRAVIFREDEDRKRFLVTLGEACTKTGCKVEIARRLRKETPMTLKWIAAELHMGVWAHVLNLLSGQRQRGK